MTADAFSKQYCIYQELTQKDISWHVGAYVSPPISFYQPPVNNIYQLPSPTSYFDKYFNQNLLREIVENTNLYAVQNNTANFAPTTVQEVNNFIRMHVLMGNLSYPRVHLYWEPKFCVPLISENISLNRFFKLRQNLHFVPVIYKDPNNTDLRPLFDAIKSRCKDDLELEARLCIDEYYTFQGPDQCHSMCRTNRLNGA
ncbi:hypothetical protein PR048_007493 [Dryococelus australis]|uniref:PiggyBac transposable element-derived protein domain-containing protein n=1 Tax=Dryococelus australis TaxID=614101 RepID=A0ABQ9HW30_9NEOP|nr:hypothetical protein PR048_007493 [Dryococelus australis]